MFRKIQSWGTFYNVILTSSATHYENVSFNGSLACSISKALLIEAGNYGQHPCLQINLAGFVRQSIPFTYTVHISMFPPEYLVKVNSWWTYPDIFYKEHFNLQRATPSYAFPVNGIMLLQKSGKELLLEFDIMEQWINGRRRASHYSFFHDIFLIFRVSSIPPTLDYKANELMEPVGNIHAAWILKICPDCERKIRIYGTIMPTRVDSFQRENLSKLAFSMMQEGLAWEPRSYGQGNLLHVVLKFCIKLRSGRNVKFSNIFEPQRYSIRERVAFSHSQVWYSIMKNFSVSDAPLSRDKTTNFHFVISLFSQAYSGSTYVFPHYVRDDLSKLKIVGCGKKGLSSLQFLELTNVYDKSVWLAIFISGVFVSLTTSLISKEGVTKCEVISVIKILLEQSNPFPREIENERKLRVIIILILLMGIVLSNAYKNTNVYKMVIPRIPVSFQYFTELVENNFQIYTRSVDLFVEYPGYTLGHRNGWHEEHIQNQSFILLSEVGALSNRYKHITMPLEKETKSGKSLVENRLLDAVGFHPLIISSLSKLLHENLSNVTTYWEAQTVSDEILPKLRFLEDIKLLEFLEGCNKTAVVMPDYISRKIYKKLIREMKLPHAFFGEESFSDVDWMFSLKGIVPPNLIKRIHGVAESGIWKWWVELFEGKYLPNEHASHVGAVSMTGNIVIVFVVWLVGIGVSIFSAIPEKIYYHIFIQQRVA